MYSVLKMLLTSSKYNLDPICATLTKLLFPRFSITPWFLNTMEMAASICHLTFLQSWHVDYTLTKTLVKSNFQASTKIGLGKASKGSSHAYQLPWTRREGPPSFKRCVSVYVLTHSVLSDSMQSHGPGHPGPVSMGFSSQEYWSEFLFPSPWDLPDPGIKPRSPALQADSLPSEPPEKPISEGKGPLLPW